MAIRPVDLQQIVAKAPDVTRDAAAPHQQAVANQQALASQQAKEQARQMETVHSLEDQGAAVIRERDPRSGGQEQQPEEQEPEPESSEAKAASGPVGGAPQPRVGRHIDIQV